MLQSLSHPSAPLFNLCVPRDEGVAGAEEGRHPGVSCTRPQGWERVSPSEGNPPPARLQRPAKI